jgi:hypothetical protein
MSDGGTPRIYPLEIYVRRGEVVLAVVGTVLFGLLMLGVAVFNWTDERGFSPPRWRVRAALVLRRLRGGSEPSASVPSARPGGGDIPLVLRVGAWWMPPKPWSREMTVRWSDLRRILIVQTRWPSNWGWIEFYVRPGTPGVAPPRKQRDEWPAFAPLPSPPGSSRGAPRAGRRKPSWTTYREKPVVRPAVDAGVRNTALSCASVRVCRRKRDSPDRAGRSTQPIPRRWISGV